MEELLNVRVVAFQRGRKLPASELIVDELILLLKVVQSVLVMQPVIEPVAARHESELLAKESPLPIEADVIAPVPLPVRMPPRVVEPVPPTFTVSVEDETSDVPSK